MANTLGVYNPIFYANEALAILYKNLGMAGRVYLGYDQERRTFDKGQQINIRRPSTFTAQNAPSSDQDMDTETVTMQLNNWKEVKFGLTDDEIAYADYPRIIQDHIAPAANALADNVDQALFGLYTDVPWTQNTGATTAEYNDLIDTRTVMRTNKVPLNDVSMLHFAVNPSVEGDLLQDTKFIEFQGAGTDGQMSQRTGTLGQKGGFEIFAGAHNVPTHSANAAVTGTVLTNGNTTVHAKGATTINIDGVTGGGDLVPGDTITIAGVDQVYAVTAAVSNASAMAVPVSPAIQVAFGDGLAVTIDQEGTKVEQNLAFHRNAFALVMPRLPDHGSNVGARIVSVQDPFTGLSLRSTVWYDAAVRKLRVALDILYGVKTLDPNLACRMRHDT